MRKCRGLPVPVEADQPVEGGYGSYARIVWEISREMIDFTD
ncbi:MAG: hypothetical protein SOX46_14705 [Clostridiaceae bacterium]|nr:hypothetical protein [Clostridium sp.]MDU3395474.1 hypothetical protein [Clostridiales bacterium]MDY3232798.1 hypothetical protein [Clostridiaceae bacterium]